MNAPVSMEIPKELQGRTSLEHSATPKHENQSSDDLDPVCNAESNMTSQIVENQETENGKLENIRDTNEQSLASEKRSRPVSANARLNLGKQVRIEIKPSRPSTASCVLKPNRPSSRPNTGSSQRSKSATSAQRSRPNTGSQRSRFSTPRSRPSTANLTGSRLVGIGVR